MAMLEGVQKDVRSAVDNEIVRAKEQFGERYHSWHEAYGVLAEELYEVDREMEFVKFYTSDLLRGLHLNNEDVTQVALEHLHGAAVRTACELIQVASVCRKAMPDQGVSSDG